MAQVIQRRIQTFRLPAGILALSVLVSATPSSLWSQRPAPPAAMKPYSEKVAGTVVEIEMVPIPAGPDTPALWFGRTEVPWDLYDVWVFGLDRGEGAGAADAVSRPSKPYVLAGQKFGHQGHPALGMTHHAAAEFTRWLSAKTGNRYRLPTEAEWEHACRAGATGAGDPDAVAWHPSNADDQPHPVGSLAANAWGLHDARGNAAEWVQGRDGTPVVKGGAFLSDAGEPTCEARQAQDDLWNMTDPQLPKSQWWLSDAPFVGFRIVREP